MLVVVVVVCCRNFFLWQWLFIVVIVVLVIRVFNMIVLMVHGSCCECDISDGSFNVLANICIRIHLQYIHIS